MDLMRDISARLAGDKGYISKKLSAALPAQKVTLITRIRKKMKNCLMDITDKMMLMKRSFVETIFSPVKLPWYLDPSWTQISLSMHLLTCLQGLTVINNSKSCPC